MVVRYFFKAFTCPQLSSVQDSGITVQWRYHWSYPDLWIAITTHKDRRWARAIYCAKRKLRGIRLYKSYPVLLKLFLYLGWRRHILSQSHLRHGIYSIYTSSSNLNSVYSIFFH